MKPKDETGRTRGSGPGWLVAAAFIGPGTVTTATLAGAGYGSVLLWALVFSTLATMALQEMAARLGLVTGRGLGEALRARASTPATRAVVVLAVVAAIGIGNAAYETGNLLGGALGLAEVVGGGPRLWALVVGGCGAALLWTGSYRTLEKALMGLVGVMALTFLGTALVVAPEWGAILRGLLVPEIPEGSLVIVVGLIGTTVVPYNLFLHASAVAEKWSGEEALPAARRDLMASIALGGLVSMAILLTSAGTIHRLGGEVGTAADMARQLEPLLGSWARIFFGVGLFAAGMTSAITAPLAAAYAVAGAAGWDRDLTGWRLRGVWMSILAIGVFFSLTGIRPVAAILFAQAANGLLLPAVALFLLAAVNDERLLGRRKNRLASNLVGGAVVFVTLVLGARALLTVFGVL
jgi:Mn2+/Fe2+ NRAMP family transporter